MALSWFFLSGGVYLGCMASLGIFISIEALWKSQGV